MGKSKKYKFCILPNKKLCKELKLDSSLNQHDFGVPYISSITKLLKFLNNMDISKLNKTEIEWYFIVLQNYTDLQSQIRKYVTKYIHFKTLKNIKYSNRALKKIRDIIKNNKVYMNNILDDNSIPEDIYYEAKKYIDSAITEDKSKRYKKSKDNYETGVRLLEKAISKNNKNNRINRFKKKVQTYKKRVRQIPIEILYTNISDIEKKITLNIHNKALTLLQYDKIISILNKMKKMPNNEKYIEDIRNKIKSYQYKLNILVSDVPN